jgi:hypothetical protein
MELFPADEAPSSGLGRTAVNRQMTNEAGKRSDE